VIRSFRCSDTQALYETGESRRFASIARVAVRKLALLDAAVTLEFLRSPPGNRLELLRGDRAGRIRASKNGMRPVHPGEVLKEEFLKPMGLSANALAKALRVPAPRINDVVLQRRGITADTAMRLARYFGGDAQSWLNLQMTYDLRVAERANARRIKREVVPAQRTR
jgi:addiction module HigA family antidote